MLVCAALIVSCALVRSFVLASSFKCPLVDDFKRMEFDQCIKSLCFLCNPQEPYINVPPAFKYHQPFRCNRRRQMLNPVPEGPFFEIVDLMDAVRDAFCIITPPECTLDEQIRFLGYAHRAGRGHKFIVGGMHWSLSYFFTNYSIPSTTIQQIPVVVVGPPHMAPISLKDVLSALIKPFQADAWKFVLAFLLLLICTRVVISLVCTRPFLLVSMCWNILGEYEYADQAYQRHLMVSANAAYSRRLRFWNKYWVSCTAFFFVIFMMFYQLPLSTHVVQRFAERPRMVLRNLGEDRIPKFALVRASDQDYYFRIIFGPRALYDNSTPKWVRTVSFDESMKYVREKGFYSIQSEHDALHYLARRDLCNTLTIYNTDAVHQTWYFSVDVPTKTQVIVNRQLVELIESGKMGLLLQPKNLPARAKCGCAQEHVPAGILVVLVALCMLFIVAAAAMTVSELVILIIEELKKRHRQ